MPTPNPKYNPGWEAIHDYHDEKRARLGKELEALTERDQAAYEAGDNREESPVRLEIARQKELLLAQWDEHHAAVRESFQMQHPTIQAYAGWVFRTFGGMAPAHDFEQLKTFEDVGRAWDEAQKRRPDQTEANSPSAGRDKSDVAAPKLR